MISVIKAEFKKSYLFNLKLILLVLLLNYGAHAQTQKDYRQIDQNYNNFKKQLNEEDSIGESNSLLSYYLQYRIINFKEVNKGNYVVTDFLSGSVTDLLERGKLKASVEYLIAKKHDLSGLIDVYEKHVNDTFLKLIMKEKYTYNWNVVPVSESIKLVNYELLPNGMVLIAFDLSELKFEKGDLSLDFEIKTIETATQLNRYYHYSINNSMELSITKESNYDYLYSTLVSKYPTMSMNAFRNLVRLKVVSDSYENNGATLGLQFVQHQGVFSF